MSTNLCGKPHRLLHVEHLEEGVEVSGAWILWAVVVEVKISKDQGVAGQGVAVFQLLGGGL